MSDTTITTSTSKGEVEVVEGFNVYESQPVIELKFFNGTYKTAVAITYEQMRQLRKVFNNLPDMDLIAAMVAKGEKR